MTVTKIQGGSLIEHVTPAEMTDLLDVRQRNFARGIKWMRFAQNDPLVPTHETIPGPDTGYIWRLHRFSATLTGADSIALYLGGEAANNRLIAFTASVTGQTTYVLNIVPGELMFPGEGIYATTSGAFRFSSYYLSAWQVPAEKQWLLM